MKKTHRLGLAPMEGVSEFPFRLWMHLTSAPDFSVTPFLRVTPTFPSRAVPERFAPELASLRGLLPYELLPQMMAAHADDFIRVASFFLNASDTVELNCGCPAPCSVGSGAGSSLLQDPSQFGLMLERIASAVGQGRFAVKMRTGFGDASRFNDLLAALPGRQMARLTVHGRTRADRYTGSAKWDLIYHAATTWPNLSTVGSGDIVSSTSYQAKMGLAPKVETALIGRGALRDPWIFQKLRDPTHTPVTLSVETIKYALAVHVILHELDISACKKLYSLVQSGIFQESCGTDLEKWQKIYHLLSQALYGKIAPLFELESSRIALGRLKMQWSSLRSSLPPIFFEPQLLRAKSVGTLLTAIAALQEEHENNAGEKQLILRHQSQYDWLYAGEKKPST